MEAATDLIHPRIAVVYCAVLEDEVRHFVQGRPWVVRLHQMEQGLHDEPDRLRSELQAAVDQIEQDPSIEAIVLGYGLCSRGSEGVVSRRAKLVIPRAHDCITVLLGSKERYAQYVKDHPGTYWYSPGWNRCHIPPGEERYARLRERYVRQYGEDNADFLMESEQHWFSTYDRATYVDMGVGATDEDIAYSKRCADWLKWKFDRVQGSPDLLTALLDGEWDAERFLVLEPSQTLRMTADHRVIEAVQPEPQS